MEREQCLVVKYLAGLHNGAIDKDGPKGAAVVMQRVAKVCAESQVFLGQWVRAAVAQLRRGTNVRTKPVVRPRTAGAKYKEWAYMLCRLRGRSKANTDLEETSP